MEAQANREESLADIIVLLVGSILLLASFAAWQWFVEKRTRIKPLVPLGVFALDKGRLSLWFLVCVSSIRLIASERRMV